MRIAKSLGVALGVVGAGLVPGAEQSRLTDNRILVEQNVLVSTTRPETMHGETLIAADPHDPDRLLGCAMIYPRSSKQSRSTVLYVSADGGRHWTETFSTESVIDSADPSCLLGKGAASFVALALPQPRDPTVAERMTYTSTDGGNTWSAPTATKGDVDRPFLIADPATAGRVYMVGITEATEKSLAGGYRSTVGLWTSRDGGATFEAPLRCDASSRSETVVPASNPVMLSDGTIAAIYSTLKQVDPGLPRGPSNEAPGRPNSAIRLLRWTDQGRTCSPSTLVAFRRDPYFGDWNFSAGGTPTLAVDADGIVVRDRLYAAWTDDAAGRTNVLFTYSDDKGTTWSKPIPLDNERPWPSDAGAPAGNFMPALAVNRDGVVAAMWYDRHDNPENFGWTVRLRASLDGGESWLPSVRVSDGAQTVAGNLPTSINRTVMLDRTTNVRRVRMMADLKAIIGGDTAGLTADAAGVFHPFWVDNRSGVMQVWTARVTVNGKATRHGDATLAALHDISAAAAVDVTGLKYDPASGIVSGALSIINESADVIRAPLKVRVVRLNSDLGRIAVLNADNRETGVGAVWDLSDRLPPTGLTPRARIDDVPIAFRLDAMKSILQGKTFRYDLIDVDLRVFAGSPSVPH